MGGTNHPSNIKLLSVKEHALAHKKLYEKYGKWQDKVAWLGLSKTIKGYKLVQLKRRLARLGKKASKETRLKQRLQKLGVPRPDMIGNTLTLGRKHSDKTKKLISKKLTGKNNGSYGRIYTKKDRLEMRNNVLIGYAMKQLRKTIQ